MTFAKFEELFKTKYPNGEVIAHGKFCGTEKTKKITVIFNSNGKCYNYYGSYIEVLNRVGIKVVSASYVQTLESILKEAKENHLKPDPFLFDFDEDARYDNTDKINEIESELNRIHKECIII